MAIRGDGPSALSGYQERLRSRVRCVECGRVDVGADWTTGFRDGRVVYRHVCPRCGAVARRELSMLE
ncbi:HVO_0649 family zinc finger protein [Halobaculum sp. D14]|uniref:HVO_0649 family zinc finger protein n=1 Tax=unclassified Halobaculum TaxID=2640896 RepID=UPI003EB6A602